MSNQLIRQLKRHEGMKLKLYKCSAKKWSIGIGRNLQDIGISEDEAETLLRHDIIEATNQLLNAFPWAGALNDARGSAMINFTFNVGIGTVKKFTNTLAYMEAGEWDKAADEMMDSKWAKQVGNRAIEVTEQIRTGKWAS
jgi:lysozyme